MKKKYLVIIFLSLFIFTGCENDTDDKKDNSILSNTIEINLKEATHLCTKDYKDEENNYILGSKYAIVTNKNIVKEIRSTEIVESNKQSILNDFEGYINANYNRVKDYGGYKYDINHEKNKLITNITISLEEFNMDGYLSEFPDFVDYLNEDNKLTIESLISFYETKDISCKEI